MSELNRRLQSDEVGMLPLHQCGTVENVYELNAGKGNGRHIRAAHASLGNYSVVPVPTSSVTKCTAVS
jgi:hypothetical protein